jgi:hypothetical protein
LAKSARDRSLTHSHLQHAESCMRLYARHLESINIDQHFSNNVSQLTFQSFSSSYDVTRAGMLASTLPYDPSLSLGDIGLTVMSEDRFDAAKASLVAAGFSGHSYSIADMMSSVTEYFDANGYQPAVASAHQSQMTDGYQPAVWDAQRPVRLIRGLESNPRLVQICALPPKVKTFVCSTLSTAADTLTIDGGVIATICYIVSTTGGQIENLPFCSEESSAVIGITGVAILALQRYFSC